MAPELAVFVCLFAGYAFLIGIAGWFIIPGVHRQRLRQRAGAMKSRFTATLFGTGHHLHQTSGQTWQQLAQTSHAAHHFLTKHKFHILIVFAILLAPLGITWLLKPHNMLGGYDDQPQVSDPVVIALLQGEQLLPPPPLPPQIFITQEVEAVRQGLAGASREWMILDQDFRQRLLTVFHLMAQKGYPMVLIEGYRSPERQTFLAGLGTHVTNAGAYQSFHQYGLAADCAFMRDGKLVISEKNAWAMEGYRLYGELAESVGLVWGGRWKMMDFGHVELRRPLIRRK